jgi:hypothetical protein
VYAKLTGWSLQFVNTDDQNSVSCETINFLNMHRMGASSNVRCVPSNNLAAKTSFFADLMRGNVNCTEGRRTFVGFLLLTKLLVKTCQRISGALWNGTCMQAVSSRPRVHKGTLATVLFCDPGVAVQVAAWLFTLSSLGK